MILIMFLTSFLKNNKKKFQLPHNVVALIILLFKFKKMGMILRDYVLLKSKHQSV